MNVAIEKVNKGEQEIVLIKCHTITEEVREIAAFVKARQGHLTGVRHSRQYEIPISEIFYIESVDGRTFLYTRQQSYETSLRLYELESRLMDKQFVRISKSTLVNLMKILSIRPAFNGRFTAVLSSGEEIIISRSYVKSFRAALKGSE